MTDEWRPMPSPYRVLHRHWRWLTLLGANVVAYSLGRWVIAPLL